ncbi:MAG: hypothetical protein LH609_02985 [Rudanella sp.]|nr:hypothetical protein [Rudanella sp.]
MTSKVLSILIVGGENSAEAFSGHSTGNASRGYVPQLVRQLQHAGWQVQVECHTPVDIHVALPLLQRLNLNRFDLILLELGHTRLQQPDSFSDLLRSPTYDSFINPHVKSMTMHDIATQCGRGRTGSCPAGSRLFDRVQSGMKLITLRSLAAVRRVGRLREIEAQLTDLLYYMQPYRRRLVMLTPMPHPQSVNNWLRQKGRDLFGQFGRRHMIPVFETALVIGRGEEFFANPEQGQLSPVAGDLLGQTLFDYIQINALLPARPELRQPRR